jgi:hypothetical protein
MVEIAWPVFCLTVRLCAAQRRQCGIADMIEFFFRRDD